MTRPVRIGTAGWSIPSLYLGQVPAGASHLERYARHLNAVEINSSFYRPHRRATYQRWAQSVPDDFRFSVKLPKAITHDAGLADCSALLDRFVDEVTGLGDKLGVLLVQLSPKSEFKKRIANGFFRDLRMRIDADVVVEPRHASWFAEGTDAWLAKRRIARVAADPARFASASEPGGAHELRYYRWHGSPRIYHSNYDAAALAALKRRLEDRARQSSAWCIFDNTVAGAALGNALELARSLRP
ncbi:DUF72 domain-containing protein [Bradyrhizobium sp.]|jgi:uncharacterized protein YecE (DUF72 family)|uniref:DUF72 domain-containing protein n=1 Tax=Bradyrhizobium sp. TaxID=376 RepID=UPI002DFCC147|nr:DUF72 domain-containing protein [Bradyrhizobium sp.]